MTNRLSLLLLPLSFVLFSCKQDDNPAPALPTPVLPTTVYYPPLTGSNWETISPKDLGWDLNYLDSLVNYVGSNNSAALIVLWKGRIVTEKYWGNTTSTSSYRIFSASKSIAGFLTGLAQEQGKLNINDKVSQYLGLGWSKATLLQEDKITIKLLITMTSGLDDDLSYDTLPGTKWYYNTIAYHQIYKVLAAAYKKTNDQYTSEQLWGKIGMQNSFWDVEPGGGPSMSCSGRDMARFGLMVMSGGKWDGTTLMNNPNYFQEMLNSSQALNPSYGYLWWLNGKASYILPGTIGEIYNTSLMPNAPNDLVAALGYGDKKIYVAKSRDLVVIRHGAPSNAPVTYALSNFDNEIWKRLMLAVK
jgi:CubicO group peptidase (beta-lactamase class C family)